MWVCTKGGFISAVRWQGGKKDPNNGKLSVRAREREALEYLLVHVETPKPKPKIKKKGGDYAYRVFLSETQWLEAVAGLAAEVDYRNFKDEVLRQAKAGKVSMAYEKALHRVWSIFGDLQPGGPYGWRRGWKSAAPTLFEDDEDDDLWKGFGEVTTPLTDEEIAGLLRGDDDDRVDADPLDPRFLETE